MIYDTLSTLFFAEDDDAAIVSKLSLTPYESDEKKELVISKLNKLSFFLQSGSIEVDVNDYRLVNTCLKYVLDNYSLSTELIECLNKIYLKYHD